MTDAQWPSYFGQKAEQILLDSCQLSVSHCAKGEEASVALMFTDIELLIETKQTRGIGL